MLTDILLKGEVLWAYGHELASKSDVTGVAGLFSFMPPLHNHKGFITLTESGIMISGDEPLFIPLSAITQLYLGFDDYFPAGSVKNFGTFWQPLRIEYYASAIQTTTVYLVINYNGLFTGNKGWFESLKALIS